MRRLQWVEAYRGAMDADSQAQRKREEASLFFLGTRGRELDRRRSSTIGTARDGNIHTRRVGEKDGIHEESGLRRNEMGFRRCRGSPHRWDLGVKLSMADDETSDMPRRQAVERRITPPIRASWCEALTHDPRPSIPPLPYCKTPCRYFPSVFLCRWS